MSERREPHEFFTEWEVDSATHKIRLKRPDRSPWDLRHLSMSATSISLSECFRVKTHAQEMREAREWLEARRSKRADWFAAAA